MSDKKHDTNILNPDRWVHDHGDYLFSFAISRIYVKDTAEDLVQETLLSAYQARNSFKGKSSERTWLVSILKRKIIDHYRKSAKNPENLVEDFNLPFYNKGVHEGGWDKERAPDEWDIKMLEETDEESLMKVLHYCLSLLSPKMSASFTLKTMEEISSEEICKELGISESNLWVLLHRARLQLRECLENKWFKE